MPLYALEDVGDAIEATKAFFLPVDPSKWLRMALIVFFVAGGTGLNPVNFGTSTSGSFDSDVAPGPTDRPLPSGDLPLDDLLLVVGAVVAALLALGLAVWLVGSVMEFVFVEALRSDEVHVRRYFRRHFGPGLRLFGFRLGVSLLSLAALAAVGAALAFGVVGGSPLSWGPGNVLTLVVLALPAFLVVAVLHGLVLGFTTVFVVPVMMAEDRGVLSAWRRFWPTLRGQWKQYAVYAVMGLLLGIATGIATGTIVGIAAILLLVPFAVVAGVVFLVAGALSSVVLVVLGLIAVVYLLSVLVLAATVNAPFQSFLRYYALFVLGDTDEAFDVVPEIRARVREDASSTAE